LYFMPRLKPPFIKEPWYAALKRCSTQCQPN
jgi:hypothetical protein